MEQYSDAEERRLADNLWAVASEIHNGSLAPLPATVKLVCEFHRRLFDGVRDHAGRMRQNGVGSEYLTFGPNRSVINRDVPNQMFDVFGELGRSLSSLDSNRNDPDYEASAIHIATWSHAEIIRIHPFEDGNGRSGRLLMNWILVRVGLRPIAMEVVKEEYRSCLNHYYLTKEIQPLVDLALRLYPFPT